MLVDRIYEYKRAGIKQSPCNSNRASVIGDGCMRKLVYCRIAWDKAKPIDLDLELIFGEGRNQEIAVISDIIEVQKRCPGLELIEQQASLEIPEAEITAHLDGKVRIDGEVYVMEIKSMSPYIYDAVNSLADFDKYSWVKKYLSQIQIYMHATKIQKGLFILKNKTTGQLKEFIIDYNKEMAEELIAKAQEINKHVYKYKELIGTTGKKTKKAVKPGLDVMEQCLPERSQTEECERCQFYTLCLPDTIANDPGLVVITDKCIIDMVDRRMQLANIKKQFEDLNDELKGMFKGKSEVIAGNWRISGKEQTRKSYTVAEGVSWVTRFSPFNK